ncbi:serine hydrolase [Isoptericola variabilis]|uniref:Beta-lactamase n=1 Tax=Isoptericola variabilis (strain 225) TaxID=743718 RepID=F6FTB2_ISOV2|nr:serine hydrolase domain-containing protein [Isoptericola variabilis]AEG45276.1 beta-lactamase [Isoptericola variabilis 225]TWH34776.1 CubicO group peptidase (beta-lactamase class C family) [Isoptericola variabilis J7]
MPRTVAETVNADYLAQWVATQAGFAGVPGVQVAVAVGGEVVLDAAWGVADVGTGEPLRTDHLFRVASHSKTFTAVAVARLAERGLLRLDDTFDAYVPELEGSAAGRVTLREALGHTGGVLRDGTDADFWQLGAPFPDRAGLLTAVLDGEVFGRGEHFKYSNLTYGLLGLVVRAVTGMPYAEHVRADLLEPLGLADTHPELDDELADRCVTGHSGRSPHDDRRLPVAPVATGALAAATGFCSTARDLVRWAGALTDGSGLLRPETRRLLHRDESVIDRPHARTRRYGLGFETRRIEGRRVVGHSGGFPGQITRTWVDPDDGLAVSVLTNAVDGPADPLATGVFALAAKALASRESADGDGDGDELDLDSWTGRFANLWGYRDVVRLGGRLWLLDPREPDPLTGAEPLDVDGDVLRPEPHAGFGPVGEPVHVLRDDDGTPAAIVVGGMTAWRAEDYERQRESFFA